MDVFPRMQNIKKNTNNDTKVINDKSLIKYQR